MFRPTEHLHCWKWTPTEQRCPKKLPVDPPHSGFGLPLVAEPCEYYAFSERPSDGVGFVELFSRALWIGAVAGLDADGPVLGGVAVSPGSSPAR